MPRYINNSSSNNNSNLFVIERQGTGDEMAPRVRMSRSGEGMASAGGGVYLGTLE